MLSVFGKCHCLMQLSYDSICTDPCTDADTSNFDHISLQAIPYVLIQSVLSAGIRGFAIHHFSIASDSYSSGNRIANGYIDLKCGKKSDC